jgi:hypothetical protein
MLPKETSMTPSLPADCLISSNSLGNFSAGLEFVEPISFASLSKQDLKAQFKICITAMYKYIDWPAYIAKLLFDSWAILGHFLDLNEP